MIEARRSSRRRVYSLPPAPRVVSTGFPSFPSTIPPSGAFTYVDQAAGVPASPGFISHPMPLVPLSQSTTVTPVPKILYSSLPAPPVAPQMVSVSAPTTPRQTVSVFPTTAPPSIPLNPNSQWELEKMRSELSWVYSQLEAFRQQAVESAVVRNENNELRANLQKAMDALTYLQKTQNELAAAYQQNYACQNASFTSLLQQRLREAENRWHDALRNLELQKYEGSQLFANQSELQKRYQGAELEIQRLRQQIDYFRDIERKYGECLRETDTLRKQLNLQENNIDHYAEESRSYFDSANSEIISLKHQLQALCLADVESRKLKMQLDQCVAELNVTRSQLTEAAAMRDSLQLEVERLSSEVGFLNGQLVQQTEKAKMATEELTRLTEDRTCTILSEQLVESEREILRLRNIIGETRLEADRLRALCGSLQPPSSTVEGGNRMAVGPSPVTCRLSAATTRFVNENNVMQSATKRRPAYFGVEVTEGAALTKKYGETQAIPGLRVLKVTGPSQAAGLSPGDIISSVNGCQVATLADFNAIVSKIVAGDEVQVVFEREGHLLGTDVKTVEKSNNAKPVVTTTSNGR